MSFYGNFYKLKSLSNRPVALWLIRSMHDRDMVGF